MAGWGWRLIAGDVVGGIDVAGVAPVCHSRPARQVGWLVGPWLRYVLVSNQKAWDIARS